MFKLKKDNKRLRLFDITRDGRGLSKTEAEKIGSLKRFFISFKDNFGKIMSVNIFMVLGNFPLIFLIATFSGMTKQQALLPSFDVFQNLSGYFANSAPSAHSMALFAQEGLQSVIYRPTDTTYLFYGIAAITLFTFGMVNVGSAYILRNIAKGEPVFVWSDFWYAVKRNWKQALPFGIADGLICGIFSALGSLGMIIAYLATTLISTIIIGENPELINNADIVIYTAAISPENSEMVRARELNKEMYERAKFLGIMTKEYKNVLCISGTHGKSTTTGMVASCFLEDDKNPTIQIGAYLPKIKFIFTIYQTR